MKTPIALFGLALMAVLATVAARSRPLPEMPVRARPVARGVSDTPAVIEPAPERPAAVVAPAPLPLPAPPAASIEQPHAVREWLLQLPRPDLARLVGTANLNRYVTTVISGIDIAGVNGPEGPRDIALFLNQLNAQILEARSTSGQGR